MKPHSVHLALATTSAGRVGRYRALFKTDLIQQNRNMFRKPAAYFQKPPVTTAFAGNSKNAVESR